MSNLETALPTPPFLRVHRSFMINGMHIRQYKANQLTLANGDSIPVGITQTPHVEAFLRQWLPELA
jgi:DNA-binding LytR/AlgR family response regulator